MIPINTYNTLAALGTNEGERMEYVRKVVRDYAASEEYRTACDAWEYYRLRNPTIMRFQKLVYNMYGQAVPDIWTPNHKIPSNWFFYFTTQAVQHLLSNGVFFQDDSTKERLGSKFDRAVSRAAAETRIGGESYGFWNYDHVDVFSAREFAPLCDEITGDLTAGVRFWKLSDSSPLMMTLYEPDGITEYIERRDEEMRVFRPKYSYRQLRSTGPDGIRTANAGNYDRFPVIPLRHPLGQSDLVGNRYAIDAYDLISSGLINNTDSANFIYWVLKNCGGMNTEDDERFIETIRMNHIAHVDGDEGGATAEPHTVETPVDAHKLSLQELRELLFTNFMGVDVAKISAGNTTATEIRAAYEPLNEKNDLFEDCVTDFVDGILAVAGIDDTPHYKRYQVANLTEETEMIALAAADLDYETRLELYPFLSTDQVEKIKERKAEEDAARFADTQIIDGGIDE